MVLTPIFMRDVGQSSMIEDFYALCHAFFEEDLCLRSINGSHITLVSKHEDAVKVPDFKPISLPNNLVNLIQKSLQIEYNQSSLFTSTRINMVLLKLELEKIALPGHWSIIIPIINQKKELLIF